MFKHPRCGGQHSTVAEARACEQQPAGTRSLTSVQTMERPLTINEAADLEMGAMRRLRRHAQGTQDRRAALAPATYQNTRSINAPRTGYYVREATPGARKYLVDLLAKRDWSELEELGWNCAAMARKLHDEDNPYNPGYQETSEMIDALKTCPYKQDAPANAPTSPAPQGRQRSNIGRIKELKEQVPDGRYAVDLPDGEKVKFFKIRSRNGYIDIKHCVSDARYPWPFNRYEEVLQAIIDATPAAAGLRFAEEYGQCYRCGRALTDVNNPYKAVGLGPDCGSK
jgi:hypothetical protein